jgi:hypothetical protein
MLNTRLSDMMGNGNLAWGPLGINAKSLAVPSVMGRLRGSEGLLRSGIIYHREMAEREG